MDNVEWLADMIYYYPSEVVTKSGCEGLAKYLLENGVQLFPSVPGCDDKYNIAEMAYNNGYEKGLADGKREAEKRGHWIIKSSGHGRNATNWAECSECHVCGSPQWKVCPVCEARMEKYSAINIKEVDFDYAAEDDNA
jgi:hypothetical protein